MLSIDVWNILFTAINLLVLAVAVRLILFKPVMKIIEERQAEADRQFENAKKEQQEASTLKAQYEQSLVGIEEERVKTVKEARKNADAQYQRIIEEAKQEARQIKDDAVSMAEVKKNQIIMSAQKDIADMVVSAAVKVVSGNSDKEANSSLYDEFLNKAGEE